MKTKPYEQQHNLERGRKETKLIAYIQGNAKLDAATSERGYTLYQVSSIILGALRKKTKS